MPAREQAGLQRIMTFQRTTWLALALASVAGCSDDGDAPPASGGTPDAGVALPDARPGSSDDTPSVPDGGPSPVEPPEGAPPTLTTNLARAIHVDDTGADGRVRLVSSNLVQVPAGNAYEQHWFGEVENLSPVTVCQVSVAASFEAGGTQVALHSGFVEGTPMDVAAPPVVGYCLRPTERGPVYSRAVAQSALVLSAIERASFTWDGYEVPDAILHEATPTLSALEQLDDGAFAGTLTGASPLYEVSLVTINFYLRDEDGLLFERLFATNTPELPYGASWDFVTSAPSRASTTFVQTLRFAAR